jgi:hypothetical protein
MGSPRDCSARLEGKRAPRCRKQRRSYCTWKAQLPCHSLAISDRTNRNNLKRRASHTLRAPLKCHDMAEAHAKIGRENSKVTLRGNEGCPAERMAENFSPVKSGERELPWRAAPIGEFLSVTAPSLKEGSWFWGVLPPRFRPRKFSCCPFERVQRSTACRSSVAWPNIHRALCVTQQRSLRHASGCRYSTPR